MSYVGQIFMNWLWEGNKYWWTTKNLSLSSQTLSRNFLFILNFKVYVVEWFAIKIAYVTNELMAVELIEKSIIFIWEAEIPGEGSEGLLVNPWDSPCDVTLENSKNLSTIPIKLHIPSKPNDSLKILILLDEILSEVS